jgi:hypothetical protein
MCPNLDTQNYKAAETDGRPLVLTTEQQGLMALTYMLFNRNSPLPELEEEGK